MHILALVEMASCLRYSLSTLNTIVKNHEETERRHVQCGPFSKQQTSLKRSSLEKMESTLAAWFKQARECNASIDGTHLKEKALHIAACLGIPNFQVSSGWICRFKRRHNIAWQNPIRLEQEC
jgi:hypothetical protein